MNTIQIIAIILMIAGVLGLMYGSFTYTRAQKAMLGSVEVRVKDTQTVYIPLWASISVIIMGSGFLFFVSK